MKPCISQATIVQSPFEADPEVLRRAGWTAVELWLTKLETFLAQHSVADARALLTDSGITPVAAASQGGLLLSRGLERATHWDHYRRRLDLLAVFGVPVLVVAPDFAGHPIADDYARAADDLAEAAELAAPLGVHLALEFQRGAPLCSSLETALAVLELSGAPRAGVCFDVFHYYTGPSKLEDLEQASAHHLAWVQLCDLSGTLRELAGDSDRILPGDGDFRLASIIGHLSRIGYDGYVSLEVLNPQLWQVPADRLADLGYQSLCRILSLCPSDSVQSRGGP
jgi:sugar phosphate isomerase/epimerase